MKSIIPLRKDFFIFASIILFVSGLCFGQKISREEWQQPEKIMDAVGIKPGMVIGEVGSGCGFFTRYLAKRLGPDGRVFANDINQAMLDGLKKSKAKQNLLNVNYVLGLEKDPRFPKGELDMVLLVEMIYLLSDPVSILKNIIPSLKPGASVVIVEVDPVKGNSLAPGKKLYDKETILRIIQDAGYRIDRLETWPQRDNIYIIYPE